MPVALVFPAPRLVFISASCRAAGAPRAAPESIISSPRVFLNLTPILRMAGDAAEDVAARLSTLALGRPTVAFVSIDTEGVRRSGGIRQVGAVDVDDPDAYFFDTVTPRGRLALAAPGLAPLDAARTWHRVGRAFWAWIGARADTVVLVGHCAHSHDVPLLRYESELDCLASFRDVAPRVFVVDTLDAARHAASLRDLRDRTQPSVYRALFGGECLQKHTALGDARSNAAIADHPDVRAFIRNEDNWKPLVGRRTRRAAAAVVA